MNILNKVVIGMASLVLLTACGPSKVSYEKFHEKAVEAAKIENGFTKVEANGKAKYSYEDAGKKVTQEFTFDKTVVEGFTNGRMSEEAFVIKMTALALAGKEAELGALMLASGTAEEVIKDEKTVYYADLSASQEEDGEKRAVKFDENGLIKSIKFSGEASGEVKFTWSK